MRGRGWKYGSGFVDGIFPVLSPEAQQILKFVTREVDGNKVCGLLDTLPPSHSLWDDLIDVSVQLRLSKRWDPIISVRIHQNTSLYACISFINFSLGVYKQSLLLHIRIYKPLLCTSL